MRLKDHPKKDGMRVWLDESETQQLIGATKSIEQELALLLMARSGLRRKEMLQVTPADLVETDTGYHVRAWAEYTKSGSYREPPVSEEVYNYARAKAEAIEPDDVRLAAVDVALDPELGAAVSHQLRLFASSRCPIT